MDLEKTFQNSGENQPFQENIGLFKKKTLNLFLFQLRGHLINSHIYRRFEAAALSSSLQQVI